MNSVTHVTGKTYVPGPNGWCAHCGWAAIVHVIGADTGSLYCKATEEEILLASIREEIIKALNENGMNRSELAARLGVSRAEVSRLMTGARNMTLKTVAGLANRLGYRVRISLERL